jgi:hypothetical protein
MNELDDCILEIPTIPDPLCVESGAELIDEIWVRKSNKPIELLPATANETYEAQLARSLEAALVATGDDKIHVLKVYQGTMPKISPNYKTNPLDGSKHLGEPADARWEWIDYRDNQPLYDWYAQVTGSEREDQQGNIVPNGKPIQVLAWAKNGANLIGGLRGYKGSFTADQSVVNGQEVANRIDGGFGFKVKGTIPRRIKLPA